MFCVPEAVRRRKQKHARNSSTLSSSKKSKQVCQSSSTSSDDSSRAKRVSFASEVSFHSPSPSPRASPRKLENDGNNPASEKSNKTSVRGADVSRREVEAIEMKDDVLTLHLLEGGQG